MAPTSSMSTLAGRAVSLALALSSAPRAAVRANDNGLALTPPMGWRSWNLYGSEVNQELIEGIMDGMVSKQRSVDGVPTSLCDLGYCDVGLDDNWQACGAYDDGAGGKLSYHDASGAPVVNADRFPDFNAMTDHAHALGLKAGWYGNNCICSDGNTADDKFYAGDVDALIGFGFDSYKLDGCGAQLDMDKWDELINASGKPIMVENCHWGSAVPYEPTADWCPWNFYRTSGDVRASYASVVGNLATAVAYSDRNLSYPGCWAYPDMLEVGVYDSDFNEPGLTTEETRSHFGAWAIVSSPLTLSHDVNNDTIMDAVWPLISNTEVIAVNQAWAGHAGSVFKASDDTLTLGPIDHAAVSRDARAAARDDAALAAAVGPATAPAWQYLYKPLAADGSRVAVLLMNAGDDAADLALDFSDVPGLACATSGSSCAVRDLWDHEDRGEFDAAAGYVAAAVASHDAAFLLLTTAGGGAGAVVA